MNRSRLRGPATIGLASAALLTTGCGSTNTKTSTSRASHNSATTTPASLNGYINSVTALENPIQTAASQFFHSPHAPETQLRLTKRLKVAYAKGAGQLSKMTPPSVGVAAQRNLVNAWSRVAAQLAEVTDQRPFSYSRAYTVAAAAERPTMDAYTTIVSLP